MRLSDLGLPPKFHDWRPGQLDAVIQGVSSDTRFTMLNLPPGTGKSPAYMAMSRILEGRSLVITQTKGLQAQLMHDFGAIGLFEIKGQANYPCIMLEEERGHHGKAPGCDEGPCHAGIQCDLRGAGCHYYDAVRKASRAKLVVANYSYWMHINRYSEPDILGSFDTLILDEAHEAVNTLSDFVSIRLDRKEVKALIRVNMIKSDNVDEWVEWAEYALKECRAHLESAKNNASLSRYSVKVVRSLLTLENNLMSLSNARDWRRTDVPDPAAWVPGSSVDWVVQQDARGASFQPVWPMAYAESYLFNGIKRVILVSATATRKDATYLGIKPDKLTYRSYPSPFPKENRPVMVIPTVKVGRDMMQGELRLWMNRIDEIIDNEISGKGIIHAVSYARAEYIIAHSRHRAIMVGHSSRNTRDVVGSFKAASAPCILVSPSVSTGWDFPYSECRFQIIAKIPFIDGRPAVIQVRSKQDREYLNYVAMVSLIQMAGRGVRAEDDSCHTYIIDDNWFWFRRSVNLVMPKWFKAAIRTMEIPLRLPRPRLEPRRLLTARGGSR